MLSRKNLEMLWKTRKISTQTLISGVSTESWKLEMENSSLRYHITAAWVAVIFDPIFGITDYFNIPDNWHSLLFIRLTIAIITLVTLLSRQSLQLQSYQIVLVPFLLISLQNAYTYRFLDNDNLLGHNLNYMALLIGAGMFVAWELRYSLMVISVSGITTFFFIYSNPLLTIEEFFVKGGLLLGVAAIFMSVLIKTRYDLTVREIKARLALQLSFEEIQAQNEELQAQEEVIRGINENLENLVQQRTIELEKKNIALEEYAFINAHKLRSPVASILGLTNLMKKTPLNEDGKQLLFHLQDSTDKLDAIVSSITKALEKGDH